MNAIYVSVSAVGILLGLGMLAVAHAGARERRRVAQRVFKLSGRVHQDGAMRIRREAVFRLLSHVAVFLTRDTGSIARLVQAAGILNPQGIYLFLGIRLLTTILAALIALLASVAVAAAAGYVGLATALGAVAGYVGPTVLLHSFAKRRRRRIKRELPLFLDSLKLLLQSGVSIEIALRHISRMETTIIPEIQRSLRPLEEDLDQGRDYPETFERWGDRLSIPEAKDVVGLLLQSLQFGGETLPMLGTMVNELIERRVSDARLAAGKRSVILTLAMVVFFLPPLILIVIAPAVVGIVRSITGMGN